MALNVKIGTDQVEETTPDLTVVFKGEQKEALDLHLKLRSALNGDLMILDHKDIDIIVQPQNSSVC